MTRKTPQRYAGLAVLAATLALSLGACRITPYPPLPCGPCGPCGPSVCCPSPCPTSGVVVTRIVRRTTPAVKGSGFLSDYTKLTPHETDAGAFMWLDLDADLRVYDAVMFDSIAIVAAPGSEVEELPADLQQRAKDAFLEILTETVDPYYDVVQEAAPRVLRVRLALTDLTPAVEVAEGDPEVGTGGATLEGEFLDAATGKSLALFVDRIEGSEKGDVAEAKWRPVEGAFREWADSLVEFLDSYHEDDQTE